MASVGGCVQADRLQRTVPLHCAANWFGDATTKTPRSPNAETADGSTSLPKPKAKAKAKAKPRSLQSCRSLVPPSMPCHVPSVLRYPKPAGSGQYSLYLGQGSARTDLIHSQGPLTSSPPVFLPQCAGGAGAGGALSWQEQKRSLCVYLFDPNDTVHVSCFCADFFPFARSSRPAVPGPGVSQGAQSGTWWINTDGDDAEKCPEARQPRVVFHANGFKVRLICWCMLRVGHVCALHWACDASRVCCA